jgi:hypothetical protein
MCLELLLHPKRTLSFVYFNQFAFDSAFTFEKFTLYLDVKAQRGSRGTALLFL